MSFQLRPYQQQAVDAGLAFIRRPVKHDASPTHGIIVCPTGGGKSLIIASIAKELGGATLVLQPSREILEQNASKLLAYGIEPAVYSASLKSKEIGPLTLATPASIKDHSLFEHVQHILIDECHLVSSRGGMFLDIANALPKAKILGLTATPLRLHTDSYGGAILKFLTRTRPRLFTEVVHVSQVGHLMKQGYLSPLDYQPVPGFTRAELAANTTGADYTEESIKRYFNRSGFDDRVVRVIKRLRKRGRKHILVFTRFVEDAEALAEHFPGEAAAVSGETPDWARKGILDDFRAGTIPIVANCAVLIHGFDFPALDTVVLAAPTLSLIRYYQEVGRAIRPAPGKPSAWVVDMVDNLGLFGKVEDLVLRPGGATGEKWEIVSNGKVLTNRYFGEPAWVAREKDSERKLPKEG